MKKVTLLLTIVALIQIPALPAGRCNLDAKGNGFEIQKTYKFEIANFEQQLALFQVPMLEMESSHIMIANPEAQSSKYDTVQIQTSAVCGMCKERIEHDMAFEKGVKSVELDSETKVLTVVYKKGKTTVKDLKVALTKIGYDADEMVADQKAHDRLPACCQKDVEPH